MLRVFLCFKNVSYCFWFGIVRSTQIVKWKEIFLSIIKNLCPTQWSSFNPIKSILSGTSRRKKKLRKHKPETEHVAITATETLDDAGTTVLHIGDAECFGHAWCFATSLSKREIWFHLNKEMFSSKFLLCLLCGLWQTANKISYRSLTQCVFFFCSPSIKLLIVAQSRDCPTWYSPGLPWILHFNLSTVILSVCLLHKMSVKPLHKKRKKNTARFKGYTYVYKALQGLQDEFWCYSSNPVKNKLNCYSSCF